MKNKLPNSVLPTKLYVILDADWRIICEKQADSATHALHEAEQDRNPKNCRVAILKTQYREPMFL
jgi:hypothetical protein